MAEQPPLTDPLLATEEDSNIMNNWVFPTPMDLPPPPLVAQEEARPHQETDQLVFSTPHRPRWRMEDGEMATTHQGGRPDLLVCPPLLRERGASDTTEPNSEVENNLGATDTHGHTTHHYVPLLLPLETANVCVLIVPNINFSYPCVDGEVECAHNSGVLLEEEGCNMITENPTPPTQQFVSGRIVPHDVT